MSDWLTAGLEDDMRPRMFALARAGQAFALATIIAADGGPRPAGSQMVITPTRSWGFLSGGCIEADVALHGREVQQDGVPRDLVYGQGSPFIDIRLPCGGRLDVLVERVPANEAALATLEELRNARQPAFWSSDGQRRWCGPSAPSGDVSGLRVQRRYDPPQRLFVIGSDPFALAMAGLGAQIGWETTILAPFGPAALPPFDIACDTRPLQVSLPELGADPWTAIAVATHDLEVDETALVPALASDAGYVGVLGSRRKLDQRIERLHRAGLTEQETSRLHAPIGLPIGGQSPWEIAVAVMGEIIAHRRQTAGRPAHTVRAANVPA